MADSVIDFVASDSGDIRDKILETLVGVHNEVVEAVVEFKEQGDVDERQDEIIAESEAVMPTDEQKIAKRNADPDADDFVDPYTVGNYKAIAEHLKTQYENALENMRNLAFEQAKAGINADYDIDLNRARIQSLRKEWAKSLSSATEMLKMVGSLAIEKITDEDGKVTEELVANDKWGEYALKASSAPSVRAKRGEGKSNSASSEGAKIRAWGKEQGGKWADLSDRGPLPADLKEAYAEAHGTL